ncbi:MAG: universal stress protein [Acidobacteriota bacterium]
MFRKILVPMDFEDVARRPLEYGLELARAGRGKVVLLAVIDDSFPNPDILSFQAPWANYYSHLRDEAQKRLGALTGQIGATGDEVEVCIVHGNPAKMILRFAEEEACDLVIMATHRTSALRHALVGSVTRKVLAQASPPVMVVHLHEGAEKRSPEEQEPE